MIGVTYRKILNKVYSRKLFNFESSNCIYLTSFIFRAVLYRVYLITKKKLRILLIFYIFLMLATKYEFKMRNKYSLDQKHF